ncbi:MAG: Uma2 family endonuclease [Leptolyngbyaceae bacterium]|nr:Uma2 family endonuclease [Leptolyngbyaceae bacterium]
MVSSIPKTKDAPVIYPSSDGEPVAESFVHLYALLVTLEVLKQYLEGQQATVLANQFLYYSQGFPKLRVAPDVMVIQGVEPGGRDSYKIWEEGEVPSVIFEMTSRSTRTRDETFKKMLYAQIGVQEYWLFDPRGEWLEPRLQGYRLVRDEYRQEYWDDYQPITDNHSDVLKLRLEADGELISFYRDDSGEKLLIPSELSDALEREAEARKQEAEARKQEAEARKQAEEQLEAERQAAEKLRAKLRELGVDPDDVVR